MQTISPHKKNGTILIQVVIIVVAIIISAALYYLVTQKKTTPTAETTTQETTEPQKTFSTLNQATGSAIPTNWKTVTQEGYIMRYPPDLVKKESMTYDNITQNEWTSADGIYRTFVGSYLTGKVTIPYTNAKKTSEEDVLVAGQKTKRISGIETKANTGTLIHVGPIISKGKEYMLVFNSGTHIAGNNNIKIFDMMVSTFTFSN